MKRILLLSVACARRVLTLSDTGCCRRIGPQSVVRDRDLGDAETGYQQHCWWVGHYLSARSPGSDQSERATCILIYSDRPA